MASFKLSFTIICITTIVISFVGIFVLYLFYIVNEVFKGFFINKSFYIFPVLYLLIFLCFFKYNFFYQFKKSQKIKQNYCLNENPNKNRLPFSPFPKFSFLFTLFYSDTIKLEEKENPK